MAHQANAIALSMDDLRAVAQFAAECAQDALEIFERVRPTDVRPRDAIEAAWAFARGGRRGRTLRDTAWAALRAAREVEKAHADGAADRVESDDAGAAAGAGQAARAAALAASAAYLHPLASADQVKHILGAAAHAARAAELVAGDDRAVGRARIEQARQRATPAVIEVLRRYPTASAGGGRVGALLRELDGILRITA